MTGLTAELAAFVAAAPHHVLPAAAAPQVRQGFADTVGVMLAAADEPVTRVLRRFVAGRATPGPARLLLGAERAPVRDAALLNATAAHALDYDDVGLMGHPSVVLVPALLAEGERLHASGAALLRAYVVGFEVWAELIGRDADRHHDKGWHPTAVFGVVAVAAAVAALRGLPAPVVRHALALAASHASGLIANFGSMAKPLHAGLAAAHGLDAVDLAEAGLTAAPDALEHHAGFLAALSPAGRVDPRTPAAGLGSDWRIASAGLTVKKYPMCFATHRVIDAVLDLARAHDLAPERVRRVTATVGATQAAMLRNHRPVTGLEARFSLEFAVAAALVARRVGLAQLDDAFVARAEVRALLERVAIVTTDTVCAAEPTLAASDRVVVETTDGRRLDSGEVCQTRGGLAAPLADGELRTKFMDCTAALAPARREQLYGQLMALDDLDDVACLAGA